MKFMLMRKADEDTERGVMPSEDLLQAMADYNEEMLKAGVLVSGEGLHPSQDGCRTRFRNGEPVVTDGPFPETRELLAGFTVLEVKSKEEAIAWATRWPKSDAGGNACLELRQLGVQIHLEYSDTRQAEQVFNRLGEGGNIFMPFEETFWAHRFGMVVDRFGTQWMISNEIDSCH